jgi:hypothetical protein
MHTDGAANEAIAYLAGLFDGEGSVNIFKQSNRKDRINPGYFLEISIGNTHKGVLQWVLENFGGRLTQNAEQYTKRNHPTWRWRASSNEASEVLTIMLPYLVVKKEQALLAVEFQKHVNTHPRKGNQPLSEEELAWREAQRVKLATMRFWKEEVEDC